MGAAGVVAGSLLLSTGAQIHQASQQKKDQKKANKAAEAQADRALQQQAQEAAAALRSQQDLAETANRRAAQVQAGGDPGGVFKLGADAADKLQGARKRTTRPGQGNFLGGTTAAAGLQL